MKKSILVMIITIVGFWALMGTLYTMGFDVIHCTGTGPMSYSNGITTVYSTDYYYTPMFHDELLTVHKDTVHHSIDKYYIYNIYSNDEYTIGSILPYVFYIFLIVLLISVVNRIYDYKKKYKCK